LWRPPAQLVLVETAWVFHTSPSSFADLVRYFLVLFEEHLELADTDTQVAVGKLVRNVEAESAELAPLQHNAVEQT